MNKPMISSADAWRTDCGEAWLHPFDGRQAMLARLGEAPIVRAAPSAGDCMADIGSG